MGSVTAMLVRIERVLLALAATFLFTIMVLVVTDVFLRYVVGRPFTFTYDLVGLYLVTGVFFLTLSHAQASHVHVAVDILVTRFGGRMKLVSDLVTCLVGGVVFALITYAGFTRALDNFRSGDVLAGLIPWPTWLSTGLVPLGCAVIVLRFAVTGLGHILTLATGRVRAGFPAAAGAGTGEHFE